MWSSLLCPQRLEFLQCHTLATIVASTIDYETALPKPSIVNETFLDAGRLKMGLIVWIIVGAIAGWLASMVMKSSGSLITNIIVGILGGFIGGWVLDLIGGGGGVTGLNIPSILTAFIGAVVLLAVLRFVQRKR